MVAIVAVNRRGEVWQFARVGERVESSKSKVQTR